MVLTKLCEAPEGWFHGYELCKSTGIKSGTLYPLLIRLHDQGLLEAEWQPSSGGSPPRHAYRLTKQGLAFAHATLSVHRTARRAQPAAAG